jgi:pseudaminic acid biosynthesis-associated methylase
MSLQLEKWRGEFGDAYIERCPADEVRLRRSTVEWANLLGKLSGDPPASILEVGANVGANLLAINRLTDAELWALEPNTRARHAIASSGVIAQDRIIDGTAQRIPLPDGKIDLVFTSGVLVHIAPQDLLVACTEIHRCARKYIVCIEYFSDEPEEKVYRGHSELLFKRDFGSFYLDKFPDLIPLDCGFSWRRTTGCDNVTWWIFAKQDI